MFLISNFFRSSWKMRKRLRNELSDWHEGKYIFQEVKIIYHKTFEGGRHIYQEPNICS
jgi:hypothetical protein